MAEFWNGLNVLQRIYFCIGLAATLVLVLQIITMLFGLGETDTGVDLDGDGEPDINVDTGDGFTLFSVRGVIAFFAIGGWVGYIFAETNTALAIVLSVVAGSLALISNFVASRLTILYSTPSFLPPFLSSNLISVSPSSSSIEISVS